MRPTISFTYPPVPTVFGVSPHGVFAAAGIVCGAALLSREVSKRSPAFRPAVDAALMWGVVAGVIGARMDYVLSHLSDFRSIGSMLSVWDGGLALFGGLIGGGAVASVILYWRGGHVPRMLDVAAPAIAVAVAIGRIGDLLILDHLGRPTTARFALAFEVKRAYHLAPGYGTTSATPPGVGQSCRQVGEYFAGCSYHLTAAYDLLGAAAIGLALIAGRRRLQLRSGAAVCLFGLAYGVQRLVVDRTRGIDERVVLGLSGTQMLAIGWIATASILLALIAVRRRGLGDSATSAPSASAPLVRVPRAQVG